MGVAIHVRKSGLCCVDYMGQHEHDTFIKQVRIPQPLHLFFY